MREVLRRRLLDGVLMCRLVGREWRRGIMLGAVVARAILGHLRPMPVVGNC